MGMADELLAENARLKKENTILLKPHSTAFIFERTVERARLEAKKEIYSEIRKELTDFGQVNITTYDILEKIKRKHLGQKKWICRACVTKRREEMKK